MILVCIDNSKCDGLLTVGKAYQTTDTYTIEYYKNSFVANKSGSIDELYGSVNDGSKVTVIDDLYEDRWFFLSRFISITEYRQKQLEQLI